MADIGKFHTSGTDTERESAYQVGNLRTREATVLAILAKNPAGLTDDEGGVLMGGDRLDFGRRRNELVDVGLVENSGDKRPTPRGRNAVVWRLSAKGRTNHDAVSEDHA